MNQNTTERISKRMGRKRIPVPVILIACLYLVVGIGGFVAHFSDRHAPDCMPARDSQPIPRVDCLVSLPCGRQSLFPKHACGLVCEDFTRVPVRLVPSASGSHRAHPMDGQRLEAASTLEVTPLYRQENIFVRAGLALPCSIKSVSSLMCLLRGSCALSRIVVRKKILNCRAYAGFIEQVK